MRRDVEEMVIIAGMVVLLCALLAIPDWRGMYEQYIELLRYEVYRR